MPNVAIPVRANKPRTLYAILLVDRSGDEPAEQVHVAESLREAFACVREWFQDDLGFDVLIRPVGGV